MFNYNKLQFDDFVSYCGISLLNLKRTLNEKVMKRLLILVLLILFCVNTYAQNPLLKRLQKKIESKVENKLLQKTDKTVDKALEAPFNGPKPLSTNLSSADLPASYNFSWKYDVQIQSQNNKPVNITYFLEPNSSYQGAVLGDIESEMFMIMDFGRYLIINLFDGDGSRIGQIIEMPNVEEDSKGESFGDYEISALPDQVIAGYKCRGMQLKNTEYLIKYYFTNDVPLTLNAMNRDKKDGKLAKVLNGINSKDPGLMMKMDLTDLKNKKNNMVMECINLSKAQKSISKKDYKFM